MRRLEGFADDKRSFFLDLAKNQSKEWSTAHTGLARTTA